MLDQPRKLDAHLWARHPQDYYVEPFWTSERLFEEEGFEGNTLDPAAGSGRIVASAEAAGLVAQGSDIRPEAGWATVDFLDPAYRPICANIVSNPPFGIALSFVEKALTLAERKVAMLLPSKWLHGDQRSRWMETTPLRQVLFLTPRPSMPPGPVIEAGISPGGGKADFAWLIWDQGYAGRPALGWLRKVATSDRRQSRDEAA